MLNIETIYTRVAAWNEARNSKGYNKELTLEMLEEEYKEFFTSGTQVGRLDALCDIVYICLGALWKLDVDDKDNSVCFVFARDTVPNLVNQAPFDCVFYIRMVLDSMKHSSTDKELSLHMIISFCLYQMQQMGLPIELAYKALIAVCDSNDSKSITKIPTGEKYSSDGKGPYYVSPTVALTKILGEANVNHH